MADVKIDLREACIQLAEPAVRLVAQGESSRFYLYSIALVAHEMARLAASEASMPFVPFSALCNRLKRCADLLQVGFKSTESMAESLYHTWRKRLHASGGGAKFTVSRRLLDAEECDVEAYFETMPGKAGVRAGYRIRALPSETIIVTDADFESLLEAENLAALGQDIYRQTALLNHPSRLVLDLGEVIQPEVSRFGALVRFTLTALSDRPIKTTSLALVVTASTPYHVSPRLAAKTFVAETSRAVAINTDTPRYELLSRHCLLRPHDTDGFSLRIDGQDGFAHTIQLVARWHELEATDEMESVSSPFVLRFPSRSVPID